MQSFKKVLINKLFVLRLLCIFCRVGKELLQWEYMRRCYLYVMTEIVMSVIRKHHSELFTPEIVEKHKLDERKILSSVTLFELDEAYSR